MEILNIKINKTQLIIFSFLIFGFVFLTIGSVSADQSQIYVNTAGNDTWDGQYASWQNTTYGPKQTIKNATGTVANNGNVYVASGTYNENNISISKNMNIIGENKYNTIINGTNTRGIFSVPTGITVTFANLTLTNGNSSGGGGAIYGYQNFDITVINSIFQNNLAAGSGGGAIYSNGYYSNTGRLTITDCDFINNRAAGGTFAGWGGAILNSMSTVTITNSNFINNAVITGVNPQGGAIHIQGGSIIVQFNRFIGNTATTASAIYNNLGYVDATLNWWGSNTGPAAGAVSASVITDPWLVLTAPIAVTLAPSSSSLIIGDLQHDRWILDDPTNPIFYYHDPAYGHVPDGIAATFAGDAWGSVNPLSGTTLNGALITNFTAGLTTGLSHPTFTVDSSGPIAGNITIDNVTPTTLVVDPVSGYYSNYVDLIATITDDSSVPISDLLVDFYVDNGWVGNALTDVSGVATISYYIIQGAGTYPILAQFLGDTVYSGSTALNNLTVDLIATSLVVEGPTDPNYQDVVSLTANLTDVNGGIYDKSIYFNLNGVYAGMAKTDGLGIATLQANLTQGATTYQLQAIFLGDTSYSGSNATNSFTIIPTSTALTVSQSAATYFNNTVTLAANLTDTIHNIPVIGRNITFTVNSNPVGSAITTIAGMAYLTYTNLLTNGTYPILVQFAGDTGYTSSSGTGNLIVSLRPTGFFNPTSLSAYYNTTINLTARLRDNNFNYLNNKTVAFWIVQNGTPTKIGEAITATVSGNVGTATLSYLAIIMPGTYQIITEFAGDSIYNASNATYNLIVNYNPTKLNATAKSGFFMDSINLTATLKDTPNNNLNGMNVNFSVNGTPIGSATTNSTGIATLPYTINLGAGIYPILAQFTAIGGYNASNSTANLTVSAAPSSILVNSITAYPGDLVNLTATMTDTLHNMPVSGKNITFSVNGIPAGSALTNATGNATYSKLPNYSKCWTLFNPCTICWRQHYVASNGTNT